MDECRGIADTSLLATAPGGQRAPYDNVSFGKLSLGNKHIKKRLMTKLSREILITSVIKIASRMFIHYTIPFVRRTIEPAFPANKIAITPGTQGRVQLFSARQPTFSYRSGGGGGVRVTSL